VAPGGFIFDASARALGCAVIPAGPGNTEQQFELIEAYRPVGYSGTPDFLKILLDAAASAGRARAGTAPGAPPARMNDPQTIARRVADRTGHFMPVSLVESQFGALEPLRPEEFGLVVDAMRQPDAIVSITVAAMASAANANRG